MSSAKGSWRSTVQMGVLAAWVGLMAFGALVVWSASPHHRRRSFPRHLLGIGLGIICAIAVWRADLRNLANISTVLLVADIVCIFLPFCAGPLA